MTTNDVQEYLDPPLDESVDDDLLAEDARRRPGRLTLVLAAAIVLTGIFAAGVLTQKHFGGSTASAAGPTGAFRAGAGGFPGGGEGFPSGGFPGGIAGTGTGAQSGNQSGTGSSGTQAGGAPSGSASGTPVVVGMVVKVSGRTITVKNFAGTKVTVTVPKTATVTTTGSTSGLSKGTTVSVAGTKASDGSVTASSVTATQK